MEIEVKQIAEFLGVDAKDFAEFKTKFGAKFITKKEAAEDEEIIGPLNSRIVGKVSGTINTILKREAGLSNEDLEGKKYEEAIALAFSKMKDEIKGLKETATKGGDEKIKEWETKYEKLNTTLKEEKEAKELLQKTLQEKETDYTGKIKSLKVNSILSEAKKKVSDKLIEMSKEQQFFFDNKIKESLKIELDDKESVIVMGADGKRIQNVNKAGDFLDLEGAILKIAQEEKYVKQNAGGAVSPNVITTKKEVTNPVDTGRKVHPNAITHATTLAEITKK